MIKEKSMLERADLMTDLHAKNRYQPHKKLQIRKITAR
jgi:hypothetical protein